MRRRCNAAPCDVCVWCSVPSLMALLGEHDACPRVRVERVGLRGQGSGLRVCTMRVHAHAMPRSSPSGRSILLRRRQVHARVRQARHRTGRSLRLHEPSPRVCARVGTGLIRLTEPSPRTCQVRRGNQAATAALWRTSLPGCSCLSTTLALMPSLTDRDGRDACHGRQAAVSCLLPSYVMLTFRVSDTVARRPYPTPRTLPCIQATASYSGTPYSGATS